MHNTNIIIIFLILVLGVTYVEWLFDIVIIAGWLTK
jgi:hypothetical protein